MTKPDIHLPQAAAAWGTPAFPAVFKAELERVDPAALPLQQGLSRGSHVSGDRFHVMVLALSDGGDALGIKAGIHYQSIIAGCSCADDPTPIDELNEYCELEILLDKASGAARIELLGD